MNQCFLNLFMNSSPSYFSTTWSLDDLLFALIMQIMTTRNLLVNFLLKGHKRVIFWYNLWPLFSISTGQAVVLCLRLVQGVTPIGIYWVINLLSVHMDLWYCRSLNKYPINTFTIGLQIIGNLLAYGNSCVNPILYAFLSEPFRRGFCAVVSCIKPAGPHGLHG